MNTFRPTSCVQCQAADAYTVRDHKMICLKCAGRFDRDTRIWRMIGVVLMAAAVLATVLVAA